MRRTAIVMVLVLTACGASTEGIEAAVAPIDEVVEELEAFQFKVEGGLTYGDVRTEWPSVSSSVRVKLNSLDDIDFSVLNEEQLDHAESAILFAAAAHDRFGLMTQAVGDYISSSGEEGAIGTHLQVALANLRDARSELDDLEATLES